MAEQLNPDGVEVRIADVVLRTPGLTGIAEVRSVLRHATTAVPQSVCAAVP